MHPELLLRQSYKKLKYHFPKNRNPKKGITRKNFRTGIIYLLPWLLGSLDNNLLETSWIIKNIKNNHTIPTSF